MRDSIETEIVEFSSCYQVIKRFYPKLLSHFF